MKRLNRRSSGAFPKIICSAFVSILLSASVSADQRTIELVDGSRIQGEVVSFKNGSYTIRSSTLGTIKLNSNQVRSILSPDTTRSAVTPQTQQRGAGVGSITSSLMSNESAMSAIQKLQRDPDMQSILSDPEIMRAVQELDFEALRNNPKVQRLMNNADVKKIQSTIQ